MLAVAHERLLKAQCFGLTMITQGLSANFFIGGLGQLAMSPTSMDYEKSIRVELVGNNCICGQIPETLFVPSTYGTSLGIECDTSTDPCVVGEHYPPAMRYYNQSVSVHGD